MSVGRFASHVAGHEIRALERLTICACGRVPVDRSGRCESCRERRLDLAYDASRETEDDA